MHVPVVSIVNVLESNICLKIKNPFDYDINVSLKSKQLLKEFYCIVKHDVLDMNNFYIFSVTTTESSLLILMNWSNNDNSILNNDNLNLNSVYLKINIEN